MEITWLGTASLMIEAGIHKILIDPYLRTLNKHLPAFPFDKTGDAEAIFITHPHLDHFADIPEVLLHTTCPVYVNARGIEIARKNKFDLSRIRQIEVGDEFTFGSLIIKAYKGRHVEYDDKCVKSALKRAFKGHLVKGLTLAKVNKRFTINTDIDGARLVKLSKTAFRMQNGETAYIKGGYLQGATFLVGTRAVRLTAPVKWYEIVLSVLPFLFIMVWGNVAALCAIIPVVGGAISGAFGVLNVLIIKGVKPVWLKILISIATFAIVFLICFGIGSAILAALTK